MKANMWIFFILLMPLVISSCSNPDVTRDSQQRVVTYGNQVSFQAQSDSNIVSVRDSIALSVWDAPQFNTRTTVRVSGIITIPLIGEMRVIGYTREELNRTLRRKLSEYLKGDVLFSLEVIKPAPSITILGMVGKPGSFPINNEVSLVEALITAGGWAELADLRYIRITHQSRYGMEGSSIEFDLTDFLENGDMRGIPVLVPGDVVIVPKKQNYVREFGDFVRDVFFLFGIFSVIK